LYKRYVTLNTQRSVRNKI